MISTVSEDGYSCYKLEKGKTYYLQSWLLPHCRWGWSLHVFWLTDHSDIVPDPAIDLVIIKKIIWKTMYLLCIVWWAWVTENREKSTVNCDDYSESSGWTCDQQDNRFRTFKSPLRKADKNFCDITVEYNQRCRWLLHIRKSLQYQHKNPQIQKTATITNGATGTWTQKQLSNK